MRYQVEGLCHRCRYVRPLGLLKEDADTRPMLHTSPTCHLSGGLLICDADKITCGDPANSTGRMTRGLREDV